MNKSERIKLISYLRTISKLSDRILDVGCGVGEKMDLMKQLGYKNVTGIDISDEMITICKNKGHDVFITKDFKKISNNFDVIIFSHILEHIYYENIQKFLEKYFSVCKNNAKVIIAGPILYDAFFNDVDHIKPYYPDGLMTLFSNKEVSKQYHSNYYLTLTNIWFRKEPLLSYNLKSRYKLTNFDRMTYKFLLILFRIIQLASFNLVSKSTGYIAVFLLNKPTI